MVCLQTDDTTYSCIEAFSKLEKKMSTAFDTKPEIFLNDEGKLKFHGAIITFTIRTLHLPQPKYIKTLQQLNVNNATAVDFIAERALDAYIAAVCRLDSFYSFNIASQIANPDKTDLTALN